jgi:N-acetylmuramic acid 6-phosphate etherase
MKSDKFIAITEKQSLYDDLPGMDTLSLLSNINREDAKVAAAVKETIPVMAPLVDQISLRMNKGGRLFYVGAGTSGRLAVTDASELPPTYGIAHDRVIALIAGGDRALRQAIEHAEDDSTMAWTDLQPFSPTPLDSIIGIAASGTTPYVIGGLRDARRNGLLTASICCNPNAPIAAEADYALVAVVGPEFVTGSTRMKSGTAEKLMLNMISTSVMIRLGRVQGNNMVDMELTNNKLINRGEHILMKQLHISEAKAKDLLDRYKSVEQALRNKQKGDVTSDKTM